MLFGAAWGLLRFGPEGQAPVFSLCQPEVRLEVMQAKFPMRFSSGPILVGGTSLAGGY
jgi:hypothetical protein